jgi:hypothetical protein
MATARYLANGGADRLVISTICRHLVFFHEAGFEYRTERRRPTRFALWNPATWRGFRWAQSADAEQPHELRCVFLQGAVARDPAAFGATAQSGEGSFKSSCDFLVSRTSCIHVVDGGAPRPGPPDLGADARSVDSVELRFVYGGRERILRHRQPIAARLPGGGHDRARRAGPG